MRQVIEVVEVVDLDDLDQLRAALSNAANCSGLNVSGLASALIPAATRRCSARSAGTERSERTTRRICLRRIPNACCTKTRKCSSSSGAMAGSARGVILTTAESTFGGGENAPGATRNKVSADASARTFTVSAPYAFVPGEADRRSATSL